MIQWAGVLLLALVAGCATEGVGDGPGACRSNLSLRTGDACRIIGGPVMEVHADEVLFVSAGETCARYPRVGGRFQISGLECGKLPAVTVKAHWMFDALAIQEVGRSERMQPRTRLQRRRHIEEKPPLKADPPRG